MSYLRLAATFKILLSFSLAILAGCLTESSSNTDAEAGNPPGSGNHAPSISGIPRTSVLVGSLYDFTPTATDEDGDQLTFSVSGLPSWASFDERNGQISGTPTLGNVGVTSSIVITVTDGIASASLAPFAISVGQTALGSVTLSWIAPTTNTDSTPLTDLAGYKIYYGPSVNQMNQQIEILNPSINVYVVDGLAPGTYYFGATAISAGGLESTLSTVAQVIIN